MCEYAFNITICEQWISRKDKSDDNDDDDMTIKTNTMYLPTDHSNFRLKKNLTIPTNQSQF